MQLSGFNATLNSHELHYTEDTKRSTYISIKDQLTLAILFRFWLLKFHGAPSPHHHLTITSPSPHHHLTITSPSPHHYLTITSQAPHHHLTITSPSPHPHLTITSPSPHHHLTITSPSPHMDLCHLFVKGRTSICIHFLKNRKNLNKISKFLRLKILSFLSATLLSSRQL